MAVRPRRRRILRWVGITVAIVLLVTVLHPEGRYLLRAGYEELGILLKRRSLDEAQADPALDAGTRQLLRTVSAARTFALDSLGLDVGETYATFSDVGRDTLLLVVTASERYALQAHTWWYPIVGTVPYKGFFRPRDALRLADRLEGRGLDVYVRPADAFSTLGWFDDPLLSTILDRGEVGVVVTVLHEIAHSTLYVPGATPFNESFASFVGYRGAERFFRSREDSVRAAEAEDGWRGQQRWMTFFESLATRLDSLYTSTADTVMLLGERERIFGEAREAVGDSTWIVNNAVVIARRFYQTDLEVFDEWLLRYAGDLRATVRGIADRVEGRDDPFAALNSP